MRYHYCPINRWLALSDAHELTADDALVDDPEMPLSDATRVRITVRMRRDARRRMAVDAGRWYEVVDRIDDSISWERPIPVCGPSRAMVLADRGEQ